jgi:Variant UBP zinc finger
MEVFTNVLDQVKVPTANDNIYSEECVFSYDTPVRKCKKNFSQSSVYVILFVFIRKVKTDYTSA